MPVESTVKWLIQQALLIGTIISFCRGLIFGLKGSFENKLFFD